MHDTLQCTAALLSNEVKKNKKNMCILSEADITADEEIVTAM